MAARRAAAALAMGALVSDTETALWGVVYGAEYARMCARFNAAPQIKRGYHDVPDAVIGCAEDGERAHRLATDAAERAVETLRGTS